MAFTARHNIASTLTTDLIQAGDNAGSIKSILLTNVHASTTVSVDLILNNNNQDFNIIKNTIIPAGTSLELDTRDIKIDTSTNNDTLRIKCSNANGVDVIINN
tara:strand:- start:109 stop:417 length:309 start_codon:yes stop_codon:yes gene_type:complete